MSTLGPEALRAEAVCPRGCRECDTYRRYADAWAAEQERVRQFIRDMYTGRFAKREEDYFSLPQWIRDAIEEDPIYNEDEAEE
jgi:hypothetical protein